MLMLFIRKFIIFLALTWSFFSTAQPPLSPVDSLHQQILKMPASPAKVKKLIALNEKAHYDRPDFIEEALETAKNIYDINGIARAYNAKGLVAKQNNNFLKSIEYYKRALVFLDKSKDTVLKINCLNNLGVSLRKINDEKSAYKYYMEAYNLAKKKQDKILMARVLNGIGNVFVNTEEYKKALFYFKKSLALEYENQNLKGQEYNFANIGESFIYTKQFDSAEYYLKKSLQLAKLLYKPVPPAIEYNLMGFLYKNKGDDKKAIYYYNLALPVLKKQKIKRYVANTYINRGLAKLGLNEFNASWKDIQKGLVIAKKIKSKENISLAYNAMVQYYAKQKNYKKALEAHILAEKFHDSIVNVTAKNNIISTQILYETKEKDEKIKKLAKEKAYQKLNSRRNFWLMIAILVISSAIIIFLYLFFSLRRKNKDLELEQKNSAIQSYILKIKELEKKMKEKGLDKIDLNTKLKTMDLTKREKDVLKLITEGYTNDQIAEKMFISKNTVKSHIKNIYMKLDVKNRIQVVRKLQSI